MVVKKKKKVDYVALHSPFMRIPHLDIAAARALLDLGFDEIYQLSGRSPESLMEEYKKRVPKASNDLLRYFRLAVYFAENEEPDSALLHPSAWN